jgi:hypothetical protein
LTSPARTGETLRSISSGKGGLTTAFRRVNIWVTYRGSPEFYPNVIILVENVDLAGILAAIGGSPDASVKDSFAEFDLTASGYHQLFEAQWIYRPVDRDPPRMCAPMRAVSTAEELRDWAAFRGLANVLRPNLLSHQDVRILIGVDDEDEPVGAILNRSRSVIGVSNFFAANVDPTVAWAAVVRAAADLFPGLPLCGYEYGDGLRDAMRADFAPVGPLRVWQRVRRPDDDRRESNAESRFKPDDHSSYSLSESRV